MFQVKDSEPKASKKRIIKLTKVSVKDSVFVTDDDGDVTDEVLKALPKGIETVDFKICINLDDE